MPISHTLEPEATTRHGGHRPDGGPGHALVVDDEGPVLRGRDRAQGFFLARPGRQSGSAGLGRD